MAGSRNIFVRIGRFYVDGFKNMTWGWQLWALILLKILILFAILRVFFFKPVLAGKSDEERSEIVGAKLTAPLDDAAALPLQDAATLPLQDATTLPQQDATLPLQDAATQPQQDATLPQLDAALPQQDATTLPLQDKTAH